MTVGQSKKADVSTDSDADLEFSSSDPSVATVDSKGSIKAKKPGTTTIRVSCKETEGYLAISRSMKLTVVPKAVKLKSAKNLKGRKFKATWKKGSGITGYEVQYSLKKNFKGAKTKQIKKAKTTKLTVKKLKKKKTYYVRIRTYKKVGSKIYRSNWSNIKKVKIKK